jgi:MFS family permease
LRRPKILSEIMELPRNVKVVCAGELLNDLGSSFVRPSLPILYRMLGASPFQYGLIEGVSTFFGMLGAAPAGEMSDRIGRKKLYWTGHAVMGLMRLSIGLASSIWMLLPVRWLYRLGMAVRYGARDPLLTDSSTEENRGLTFAVYELSDCIGSFLGPLLPILILGVLGQSLRFIRGLFILSFIPNLVAVLLIIKYVTETVQIGIKNKKNVPVREKLRIIAKNRNLLNFTGITTFSTLFTMTVDLELLYLTYGSLEASALFSSIMFTFWTGTTALAALPAGRIVDKVGRKRAVMLAFLFQAASLGIILIYHFIWSTVYILPLAFTFLGLYDTFFNVSSKTFVADNTSMENRGMLMGLYTSVDGVSRRSLAPVIAGFIFSNFSYATPFILGLAVSLFAVLLLTSTVSESKH